MQDAISRILADEGSVDELLRAAVDSFPTVGAACYYRFIAHERLLKLDRRHTSNSFLDADDVLTAYDAKTRATIHTDAKRASGLQNLVAQNFLRSGDDVVSLVRSSRRPTTEEARACPETRSLPLGPVTGFAACSISIPSSAGGRVLLGVVLLMIFGGRSHLGLDEMKLLGRAVGATRRKELQERTQMIWRRVFRSLNDRTWPRDVNDGLNLLLSALEKLNELEADRPILKYASMWCFVGDADQNQILSRQRAACFVGPTFYAEKAKLLPSSQVQSLSSRHPFFELASDWKDCFVAARVAGKKADYLKFVQRIPLHEFRSGFIEYDRFRVANHLKDDDVVIILPIADFSPDPLLDGSSADFKGIIVLYVEEDARHELLPTAELCELSGASFTALERGRIALSRELRTTLSEQFAAALSSAWVGRSLFVDLCHVLARRMQVEGCSIYLHDPSDDSLILRGANQLFEIRKHGKTVNEVPPSDYPLAHFSSTHPGKTTWRFFSDPAVDVGNEGNELPQRTRSCFRTEINTHGCREEVGACTRMSEIAGPCWNCLEVLIHDHSGRPIGVMRLVNRIAPRSADEAMGAPIPLTAEEGRALSECAAALGLLIELEDRIRSSDQLLRRVGHEMPMQIGIVLQNLEEAESISLASSDSDKSPGRGHLANLFDEMGYSAMVVEYYSNISTLLSRTKEQIQASKREFNLFLFLAKLVHRLRVRGRQRGVYVEYSESIEAERPRFMADRSFDLALTNILNNAIQYCAFGSCVEIEWIQTRSGWDIVVADAGIPLPKGKFETTIYRDGYRAPEAEFVYNGGSGFGLTVARHVIGLHDFTLRPSSSTSPLAQRNAFGLNELADLRKKFSSDNEYMAYLLQNSEHDDVSAGDLIQSLALRPEEAKAIEKHAAFGLPHASVPRAILKHLCEDFLDQQVEWGDDIRAFYDKYLFRPIYRVDFKIGIPSKEVL